MVDMARLDFRCKMTLFQVIIQCKHI